METSRPDQSDRDIVDVGAGGAGDDQAIAFLRTEALYLPDSPKGFLLICYQNRPLGWVKNIGSRSNNLYPEHWRIRMQLDPTAIAPTVI